MGALLAMALVLTYFMEPGDTAAYTYSQLLTDAAGAKVDGVVQDGNTLTITFIGTSETQTAIVPSDNVNVYAEVCAAAGAEPGPSCEITYEAVPESATGGILTLVITAFLRLSARARWARMR